MLIQHRRRLEFQRSCTAATALFYRTISRSSGGLFACLSVLLFSASLAAAQITPFTVAVLPDTQNYARNSTGDNAQIFSIQTQWIVANASQQNIIFVTHLGDVVHNAGSAGGSANAQWNIAVQAMQTLRNSTVSYAVLPGNHDWTNSDGNGSLEHYRSRFGDTSNFFTGKPWFLGFDQRGVNSAQLIQTDAGPILHLALEFRAASPAISSDRPWAPTSPLAWAQAVLNAHPGVPTIVSIHDYINARGVRNPEAQPLFEQFIAPNDQIFMVLNGHHYNVASENMHIATNNAGRQVYEILSNYQGRNRGGDGWLRLLRFDPDNKRILVQTYSPMGTAQGGEPAGPEFNNAGRVDNIPERTFEIAFDFDKRFAPIPEINNTPPAPEGTEIVFANGIRAYAGTIDTEIRRNNPIANLSAQGYMHIDTDEGGDAPDWPSHALIRFTDLFGQNAVPHNRGILNATLRLYVHESRSSAQGSGFEARRMLRFWSNFTTWNSPELAPPGGGQTQGIGLFGSDGVEAIAAPDDIAGAPTSGQAVPAGQWIELDVTRSLRAFHEGANNFGWLLQAFPGTTDAVRVETSETNLPGVRRPQLVITHTNQRTVPFVFTEGLTILLDESDPGNNRAADHSLPIDAATDNANQSSPDRQVLLNFHNVIGSQSGAVRPGMRIASAVLRLHIDPDNPSSAGGGFTIHRMLRTWNSTDNWDTLDAGVCINNTDAAIFADDRAGVQLSNAPWDRPLVQPGPIDLDVTDALRGWSASAAQGDNTAFGWALIPHSQSLNATIINTFNAADPAHRPRLIVRVAVCDADRDASGDVSINDYFLFLSEFFQQLNSPASTLNTADLTGDGMVTIEDYFTFLTAFFSQLGPCT